MKFANYERRAVVTDRRRALYVADVSAGRFSDDPADIFTTWDEFVGWARSADLGSGFRLYAGKHGAPSPRPRQVFAVGLNYAEHARESGMEEPPSLRCSPSSPPR